MLSNNVAYDGGHSKPSRWTIGTYRYLIAEFQLERVTCMWKRTSLAHPGVQYKALIVL